MIVDVKSPVSAYIELNGLLFMLRLVRLQKTNRILVIGRRKKMSKLIKLLEQMDADVEDRWIAVIAILMVVVWILGVHFQWI